MWARAWAIRSSGPRIFAGTFGVAHCSSPGGSATIGRSRIVVRKGSSLVAAQGLGETTTGLMSMPKTWVTGRTASTMSP